MSDDGIKVLIAVGHVTPDGGDCSAVAGVWHRGQTHIYRGPFYTAILQLMLAGFCLLLCVVPASAEQPQLIIVHADWCGPCRQFDAVYKADKAFRDTLHNAFDVRECDWAIKQQAQYAATLGVKQLPTYVVLRHGKIIARKVGFEGTQEGIARFFACLNVEWPPAQVPRVEPKPQAPPETRAPDPVRPQPTVPPVDEVAREGVEKLAVQAEEIKKAQTRAAEATGKIQAEIGEVKASIGAISQAITGLSKPAPEPTAPAPQKPADIFAEPRPPQPSPTGPTASKWLAVLGWIGKTAVIAAAPEFALPATGAIAVLGYAVSAFRKRRGARHPPGTFPRAPPDESGMPNRDQSEIRQILDLRQQEQRDPIHDAFFGVLFEDEYKAKPDQPIKEAWLNAMDRFNNIAPLSARSANLTAQSN